jgi:hypothetical protein
MRPSVFVSSNVAFAGAAMSSISRPDGSLGGRLVAHVISVNQFEMAARRF